MERSDQARKPELEMSHKDMQYRMLFRPIIESLKCLEEGVINHVADANVGSILGIGHPCGPEVTFNL
jgi:3-hydroxyacyl-CoA dehydrogenase/enoyl-CoA hydratase/3-hydroxybutyryl-CoA epimerase